MSRWKATLLYLLRPGTVWVALMSALSTLSLFFVFTTKKHETLIAYVTYVFSAYVLIILVIIIIDLSNKIKIGIYGINGNYGNRYIKQYRLDIHFRTRVSLYFSLGFNLIYAVFKLSTGFFYGSIWFGAVAVYYIILSVTRFLLLRYVRKDDSVRDMEHEYGQYRLCGYLLFVVNIALVGMVIQMVHAEKGYQYPGYMIYAVAFYAFYILILAIINVVKYRRLNSPVLSAVKGINFTTALVAMLSLQTAMFASFGGEDRHFERIMNTVSGSAVCITVLCLAMFMVARTNNELKKLRDNKF